MPVNPKYTKVFYHRTFKKGLSNVACSSLSGVFQLLIVTNKFFKEYKQVFLSILLFFIFVSNFGQTQQTIISRVTRKDTNLIIFTQKNWDKFIIAAAVDKRTHISYLISCYGGIVDSFYIADGDYGLIEKREENPFKHYNAICDKILSLTGIANKQLCENGKLNSKWEFSNVLMDYLPQLKTSTSVLQKIIVLDQFRESYLVSKWLVNNDNPKYFKEDTTTLYTKYDKAKPGTMIAKSDTTLYYNQNNIARAYKALLINKEAKLFYYDRDNSLIDSLPLNHKKIPLVLKQKTDVFLLYRGWLEIQKQSMEEGIRILDSTNKKYPNTLLQFANEKSRNLNEVIFEATQSLIKVTDNINTASSPDPKAIATFLHQQFKNVRVNTALLSSLGVGYMITVTRGKKLYEFTDHRGNILAVVSDKKIQVNANNGGIVDYYVPDIVSATDYSSFGAQLPGRTYQSEKYRYSINGQEKSTELNPNLTTAMYWEYDSRIGRRWNLDPKPFVDVSDYSVFDNNPILRTDPNGDCPICGLIGAGVGALVGGGIELGKQLWEDGKVTSWKSVAGSTVQGAVTGGVAGLTGGTSLLVTITAAGTANAVGGAVNNAVQGKQITVKSVATDFGVGAVFGAAGKYIGDKVSQIATKNNLLKQLSQNGVKNTTENVVGIGKNSTGKIIFLETGNAKAGLIHILQEHGKEFTQAGIAQKDIPKFLMQAALNGKVVDMQKTRPIFETVFNGVKQRVAITISNNGFIVGANIVSKTK